MKKLLLLAFVGLIFQTINAQETTRRDTLQGGLRFERTCFDVLHYGLNLKVNPLQKSIVGFNEIQFKVIEKTNKIQLDLFENMIVDSIIFNNQKLKYTRDFGAIFIDFKDYLSETKESIKDGVASIISKIKE